MNKVQKETILEQANIMIAYANGAMIQKRECWESKWHNCDSDDDSVEYFNFYNYIYRINPEPRRMTNRELNDWFQSNLKKDCSPQIMDNSMVSSTFSYKSGEDYSPVKDNIFIRTEYGEWKEPIIDEYR